MNMLENLLKMDVVEKILYKTGISLQQVIKHF